MVTEFSSGIRLDSDSSFRSAEPEVARIDDLLALVPPGLQSVLDVGARDGFISKLLADRVDCVTALDVERPKFRFDRVHRVDPFPESWTVQK